MAGNVDFARASAQLRQLFQSPTASTQGGILNVTEKPAQLVPEDLSHEAQIAYRKAGKRRTGGKGATRPSTKAPGGKSKPKQAEQGKNGFHRRTGERDR